jgi:hypothetical protein
MPLTGAALKVSCSLGDYIPIRLINARLQRGGAVTGVGLSSALSTFTYHAG